MGDAEEFAGVLGALVAVAFVEADSAFASIEDDAAGAAMPGTFFELDEDLTADTFAPKGVFDGHVADLRFVGGVEVDAADADEVVAAEGHEVAGSVLVFVAGGFALLGPGLAEDAPAEIVVQPEVHAGARLANVQTVGPVGQRYGFHLSSAGWRGGE